MADSFSQIYIHFVFAVKYRKALISNQWKVELYQFICVCFRKRGQRVLAINGVEDHIHILAGMTADCRPSDLVREVKLASNHFINERKLTHSKFYWQEGFGAFSYARSMIPIVAKYIDNQANHHAKEKFVDEYVGLLDKSGIDMGRKLTFNEPI